MFRTIMVVSVALAVGAAAVVGARQLRQDQPGFETGAVPVTVANEPGVTVLNEPTVAARQAGSWTVSLSREQPLVAWTTPEFLQVGVAYTFNWPGGGSEEGRVLAVANGGWVRVETDASQLRWLNSSLAEEHRGVRLGAAAVSTGRLGAGCCGGCHPTTARHPE